MKPKNLNERIEELKAHLKSIEIDGEGHYSRPMEAHDIHERLEELIKVKSLIQDKIAEIKKTGVTKGGMGELESLLDE